MQGPALAPKLSRMSDTAHPDAGPPADKPIARVHGRLDGANYQVNLRAGHHRLVADEHATLGGGDTGPNPFALLLSGLASCTAITLRMYAQRKGWPLQAV